jgi:hypothetical protein
MEQAMIEFNQGNPADVSLRLEDLRSMRSEIQAERKRREIELVLIDDLIAIHQGTGAANVASKRRNWWHSSPGIMHKAIRITLELYDAKPRPIKTGEVIIALRDAGLVLGGASPSANVSSYLNHGEELANIRGHGWVRKRDLAGWNDQLNLSDPSNV